jgi:hypothetical protein
LTQFLLQSLGAHARAAFASGNARIDRYFRETVSQHVKRGYAACYVLVERNSGALAGFYALSARGVPLEDVALDLRKKLPRYPSVPAVLIGWMGRDLRFRRAGVGALLLYDAVSRIANVAAGAHAICTDAIDDAVAAF